MIKIQAFTLPEVILVIALIGIIFAGTISYTRTSILNTQFETAINEISSKIISTRNLSRKNYLDMTSGIAFREDGFTEFTATTYDANSTSNLDYELPSTITIEDINFGGLNELYFTKYTGLPVEDGQLTIMHQDGRTAILTVNPDGTLTTVFSQ